MLASIISRMKFFEWAKLTSKQIAEAFARAGYRILKTGSAAIVFYKHGDEVTKIFKADDGYRYFVNLTRKYRNPHFPNIRVLKRFSKGKFYGWYLAKMEVLQQLSDKEYMNIGYHCFLYKFLTEMDYQSHELSETASQTIYENHTFIYQLMRRGGLNVEIEYRKWEPHNKAFIEAFKILYNQKTRKFGWDLHQYNIMKRGSTWVIIDPYDCRVARIDYESDNDDVVSDPLLAQNS